MSLIRIGNDSSCWYCRIWTIMKQIWIKFEYLPDFYIISINIVPRSSLHIGCSSSGTLHHFAIFCFKFDSVWPFYHISFYDLFSSTSSSFRMVTEVIQYHLEDNYDVSLALNLFCRCLAIEFYRLFVPESQI